MSRLFLPEPSDYVAQNPGFLRGTASFLFGVRMALEEERPDGILDLHSHPFARDASFSAIDDDRQAITLFDFRESDPDCLYVRGVIGQREEGFTLEAFPAVTAEPCDNLRDGGGEPVPEIEIVGAEGVRRIRSFRAAQPEAPAAPWLCDFQRNTVLRSRSENQRLSVSSVAVVGCGGIGGELARLLSLAGVTDLALIDPDTIERENFNRLDWATPEDIGRPKVEVRARTLMRHDPTIEVRTMLERFPSLAALEALEASDLVVVGVDDDRARYAVLRWCVRHLRPAVDAGTGISLTHARDREAERSAHVWVYMPGAGSCWMHMGLDSPALWDEELLEARRAAGYVVDADTYESPGSAQSLNAIAAGFAVGLAEQILLGRSPGPLATQIEIGTWPATAPAASFLDPRPDASCPLCGSDGIEGIGGDPFGLRPPSDDESFEATLDGLRAEKSNAPALRKRFPVAGAPAPSPAGE